VATSAVVALAPLVPTAWLGAQVDPRDADVTITAERLEFVLAAYRPAMAALERSLRFYAQADSAERARERWNACIEKAKETFSALSEAKQQEAMMALMGNAAGSADAERLGNALAGVTQRAAAVTDRTAPAAILLADSAQGIPLAQSQPMLPGAARCGRYPFMSAAAAQALSAKLRNQGPDGQAVQPMDPAPVATAKASLSKVQYGRIRERIAFWALQQRGELNGNGVPFKPFTPEEVAVLTARQRELTTLAGGWQSGLMPWAQWRTLAW
jgi:hypothetical protein